MTSDTQSPDAEHFELPRRLDTDAALDLREDLIAQRGLDLTLNGAEVAHLGAQCLAVLLSAARTWREDDKILRIEAPSDPMTRGLTRMGASLTQISTEETSDAA